MEAEGFAEAALGAGALNGIADFFAGDDAEAQGGVGEGEAEEDEMAAVPAAVLVVGGAELGVAAEALLGAEGGADTKRPARVLRAGIRRAIAAGMHGEKPRRRAGVTSYR